MAICLVSSLYKILDKMPAFRIKRVIGTVISLKQTAFVPGRNILDNMFLVNEAMDLAKREKMSCLVVKLNYEKTYDSVGWNYLKSLLSRMGFGNVWCKWMEACIFSSSMSVLVNGSVTKDFFGGKWIKAG